MITSKSMDNSKFMLDLTYNYVNEDDIDDDLKGIHISHQPLTEPTNHKIYGDSFCEVCILKTNYKCPICRTDKKDEYETITIRSFLNKLQVKCNSCDKRMNKSNFNEHKHKNICSFNCGEIINRNYI